MRWFVVAHLSLCALLVFQQPSVRMVGGERARTQAEEGSPVAPFEEEEVPGLRASAGPRTQALPESARQPPVPVPVPARGDEGSPGLAPL